MKAILVLYDSLSRNFLSPYGCDFIHTPNFDRLAQRAIRFDRFFVGSMPCMPARRELHTGRYNFLHRAWGPLEPFDDSMPELLRQHGTYTHLVTDHYHYLEDGGATYHNRFSTWEVIRGQEGDPWKGEVGDPAIPPCEDTRRAQEGSRLWRQDWVNRKYLTDEAAMPQSRTFAAGLEFIETNHDADNWFLQIEAFDPHEPFFTQPEYQALYPHEYHGRHCDWPDYAPVRERDELVGHLRAQYSALVSMCDAKLGLVLDAMDRHGLWQDTMLIVGTDHGFLLGEHDWWAKNVAPLYDEVANTPFFLHDPRCPGPGVCDKLTQTIDLAPTLLEFFGVDVPTDMQGKPLRLAYDEGRTIHEQVLYGYFGGTLNTTDGRYTYFRAPRQTTPLSEYTLMPTVMNARFPLERLAQARLSDGFGFTKGAKVLEVPVLAAGLCLTEHRLYDRESDPGQNHALDDAETEARLCRGMAALLASNEAPLALYERFALPHEGHMTAEDVRTQRAARRAELVGDWLGRLPCEPEAQALCLALAASFPAAFPASAQALAGERARQNKVRPVTVADLTDFLEREAKDSTIAQEMCRALPVLQAYAKA